MCAHSKRRGFQSSPGLSTGCNLILLIVPQNSCCFNPHPAFRPGATYPTTLTVHSALGFQSSPGLSTGCNPIGRLRQAITCPVSILTRPFDRVQQSAEEARSETINVSILTRPFDRVQPVHVTVPPALEEVSILTRPFDRVQPRVKNFSRSAQSCFNPHPAFRPGATQWDEDLASILEVSILTRPFDRVQRKPSAPNRGANYVSILTRPFDRVQLAAALRRGAPLCFNPHPAFRPGATANARSL